MISGFSLIMMAGVMVGTYSTIFIAAQILIWFKFSVENYRAFLSDKKKRVIEKEKMRAMYENCLLYTSPSPRDRTRSRMPSSA